MRRSLSWAKATMEGVVRAPSAFSMTLGEVPSMTATHEFVVPRSIPITLAMCSFLTFGGRVPGLQRSALRAVPCVGKPRKTRGKGPSGVRGYIGTAYRDGKTVGAPD